MPGMKAGLPANNPTIVAAFHRQLLHQGLIVLLILALVGVAWNLLRARQLRDARTRGSGDRVGPLPLAVPEVAARRLLRVSFGLLWIFDGILQGQSSMPLGMAPQVIRPAAASSPTWVQNLDHSMASIWSYHPIAAPASAVWIQVGIGAWLLFASHGTWSRLGGLAAAGWGLIVWVFGEAFGQIFAPGLTVLFGAPGAALFYCAAGVLIALPERSWSTPSLGRGILRTAGAFSVGMAVLQAWPGRKFWQGRIGSHGSPGTLDGMIRQMERTPQPHLLASWVTAFGSFDAAHGFGVNLFAVIALAAVGILLLTARPRPARIGVVMAVVLCLADWVLIEDFGFLGGVGTDPNSMIPMVVLLVGGYLALTRPATSGDGRVVPITEGYASRRSWRQRLLADPAYAFRTIAALGAVGIVLVGVAPVAAAAVNPNADPILTQAINGAPQAVDGPAPPFRLIDQNGKPVTLGDLRGKTIALTNLDDTCTVDCPIIAQELKVTDRLLGSDARRVVFVAINANPRFLAPDNLRAFDHQEGLAHLPNWLYLTATSVTQLQQVWRSFGQYSSILPAGAMVEHSEFADVIGPGGRIRYLINTDPGPATQATRSSFSVVLADTLRAVSRPR
ncbi:MAG: SCO family protein [Acidimicrobiales bacterium]